MVLNGEEGMDCEVHVDKIRLENVSKFKYLKYVLDESGTDKAESNIRMARGRRITGV